MKEIISLIKKYGDDYLVCDGNIPLLSNGSFIEELLLYGISTDKISIICDIFYQITGKEIGRASILTNLSGGQRIILMTIFALNSPADKILLNNVFHFIDDDKIDRLNKLIEQHPEKIVLII